MRERDVRYFQGVKYCSDYKSYPKDGGAGWGGGAVDAGCVESLLAAALSRVMRAAVPIPAVADASVSPSAAVGGSVVGVVGLL